MTSAMAIISAAEIKRNASDPPSSTPKLASAPPMRPKVSARPAASANGAAGPLERAPAITIGASGSTHGLRIVSKPARNASGSVVSTSERLVEHVRHGGF